MSSAPKVKYDEFKYILPPGDPGQYAEQARKILVNLNKHNPKYFSYLIAANTVLTLSGIRTFDTYMAFFDDMSEDDIERLTNILNQHDISMFVYDFSNENRAPCKIFSIINHAARGIDESYRTRNWQEPPESNSREDFSGWIESSTKNIEQLIVSGFYPKAWSARADAANNICQGMLYGYPGKAISSMVWNSTGTKPWYETFKNATIKHHDKYMSAWPVYGYTAELKDDQEILIHEKFWSEVLSKFYEDGIIKQLTSSDRFAKYIAYHKEMEAA